MLDIFVFSVISIFFIGLMIVVKDSITHADLR